MTVETHARATPTRRCSALAALIGVAATALTLTGMGAAPTAQAAPAVAATGVLLEAGGTPVADATVRRRGDWGGAPVYTDEQGRFTVPLNSEQPYALDFTYPTSESQSTLTIQGSTMPPVTESIDLGAVTMPPLINHQIRVVDVDGAPVHRGYLHGSSNRLSGYDWQDRGAHLTASGDMVIAEATFDSAERSDSEGILSILGPRMATKELPVSVAHKDVWAARTVQNWNPGGTHSTDGVWTVPLKDFRIHIPTPPPQPTLKIVDENTIRVTPRPGSYGTDDVYDGGSIVTGYEIVVSSTEGTPTAIRIDASQDSTKVTGLTTGMEHTVRLRAVNIVGTSDLNFESYAIVPAGPPSRIKRPTATVGSKPRTKRDTGNVIIKWKTPKDNGARLAWFYVSANGGKPTRVHHSRNRLRTPARVGRHRYTITAINMRGFSKPSKPVTVRVRLRR